MLNFTTSFLENIHETIDPYYLKQKKELKRNLQPIGLAATSVLITSVAFLIFGISLTTSCGIGAIVGLPLILINLPLCYLSFNTCKTLTNINDIIDNLKRYQKFYGLDPILDKNKIKRKLEQGTFCFNWMVDLTIEEATKSGMMR